jgi:hypothetical protein
MDDRRRKLAIAASLLLVMLSCHLYTTVVVIAHREELVRQQCRRARKRKRENNDLIAFLGAFGVAKTNCGFRRFWVDARSSHWIYRILDGMVLQGEEFDKFFRISCNSFNTLHALLGIISSLTVTYHL